MRTLAVLAMTCLLAACAQQPHVQLYPGSPLPAEQIVTLTIPSELEVLSINGQAYSAANSMFGANDKQLHLQPGSYRINAFYKNGFDIDGGISHEVVRGRTAIFEFDGEAGDRWKLDFKRPQNLEQARKFADSFPAWAVEQGDGERIEASAGGRNVSAFNAMLLNTEVQEQPTTVAPLGAQPAGNAAVTLSTPAPQASLPHSDATLTTLQQMWNLLSPESRKAFLEWAQQ